MRTRTLIEKLNRIEEDASSAAASGTAVNCIVAGGASGYIGAWAIGGSLITGVGVGLVIGSVFAGLSNCFLTVVGKKQKTSNKLMRMIMLL